VVGGRWIISSTVWGDAFDAHEGGASFEAVTVTRARFIMEGAT
jgi:hypothetical protein